MIAERLIMLAARRWPADLAADLEREWLAELSVLRGKPLRRLSFAASLAASPAIDGPTWEDRARSLATPVVLTLIAAALFNGVRLAQQHGGQMVAAVAFALALAAMGWAGRRTTPGGVVMLGACVWAFLLAGNPVAVMPFMGWRDIGPALATWTVVMALVARSRSALAAVAGTLVALDLAVVAGSVHGALSLGVPFWAAPLWLPQTFLPSAGHPVLIGNAAAIVGVLLFVSAYVLSGALRRKTARPPQPGRLPAGLAAAVASVAVGEVLRRSPRAIDAVFGFGFLSHPAGLAATALVIALAAAYRPPVHN
ncbi:hypothetical protein [Actinoplanes sp. N902-109]|uniref:hypothetical protein n=1 Tax=Actinoplanes sp. (strain N902-109) TaxID=649831 RepID=UPI0003294BA8|nr:hypothetical protein [Actinoplanes sp. N902-109]AGL14926.1 hypothetical protein L083_1416 [Actinoplanes sp. N902-109]